MSIKIVSVGVVIAYLHNLIYISYNFYLQLIRFFTELFENFVKSSHWAFNTSLQKTIQEFI